MLIRVAVLRILETGGGREFGRLQFVRVGLLPEANVFVGVVQVDQVEQVGVDLQPQPTHIHRLAIPAGHSSQADLGGLSFLLKKLTFLYLV